MDFSRSQSHCTKHGVYIFHLKLFYDPSSVNSSVVQVRSVVMNHPELMKNYPMILVAP